ncbi:MAG: Asp-tRNA(Asn)/Glu-tRNA(Gln) amidotransferase subunit GatA [Patescibacteria group bacterium]
MSLNELTITQARDGLRKKEFSSEEITRACIERIKRVDETIHSYLSVFSDSALNAAREVDKKIKDGESLSDIAGIPIAMKDNMCVKGEVASAASKILSPYRASYDATVVSKLKNARAVFLGRTNMDEFAMGSSTENSAFGATRNPFDAERVPGGSSGGSAAAVAAHECIAALGSDTGGSIRQPAAFCGIVGLKPTYGAVSRHGLLAMASSLDQIGPLTKTVADSKILFDAICGKDIFDSTTVEKKNQESRITNQGGGIQGLKIGVPKEYFDKGLDPRIADSVHRAIEQLVSAGAEMVDISLPHSPYALATYYIIMSAEVSANLARYDGIRYGYSVENESDHATKLYDIYANSRGKGFGAEVKRRVMLGTYVLSAGYYDAYYLKAQKVRRLIHDDFKKAFEKVDVIIGPTSPMLPFRFGERVHDPLSMYIADVYTVAVNLAGVPAISAPFGKISEKNSKGLEVLFPAGVQIIGKWFDENALFEVAGHLEKNRHN